MNEIEWLGDNQLSLDIWNKKYRVDNEDFEEWLDRVSNRDENIKNLIRAKKFIFGGRTLANRGTDRGSYSNCYSIGYVPDDLIGILDVNTKIALTFKAQGGQGLSLSLIRPEGASIRGKFKSDGIVPFMEMFNTTTASISQGSHRRGALLMSLDIWHKEAAKFITIKSDLKKINNANLSLEIDDAFMEDIEAYYLAGETRKRVITQHYTGQDITYEVVPIELYKLLCKYALKYAEPGILYVNRMRNYNMMQFHSEYRIETCNPCSEQPLPKHGACNLCSINLSEFVLNPYTDKSEFAIDQLKAAIKVIVPAMDKIIDENADNHALPEQKEMALNYRNIGIGVMGLHDCLVKLGLTYGSNESLKFTAELMRNIFRFAVTESVRLGKDLGSFPKYEPSVWDSDIIKNTFNKQEIEHFKQINCLRNCSLLTVAPTGSIGTMFGVSTGVEPFFAVKYTRRTVSLDGKEQFYDVYIDALKDYQRITGNNDIPVFFNTSAEIDYNNRILMQAALQDYCDTAISSTINLPKGTTQEVIEDIYLKAWKAGLKGVTVYVDGSRDPILSTDNKPKSIPVTGAPKRPETLPCDIYKVKVKGENFIVCVGLYDEKPYEVFVFRLKHNVPLSDNNGTITKKSKGVYSLDSSELKIANLLNTDISVEEKAATLYSSMLLRHGINIKYIIKTAKKVNDNITSFSSAMCRVLAKYVPVTTEGKCPECGADLVHSGGCVSCSSCGYSRCE